MQKGKPKNTISIQVLHPHQSMKSITIFRSTSSLSYPLELWAFLFRHTPHKTWCNCFLNLYILMLTRLSFPICKYINNTSRQDLLNPEKTKNHNPHRPSNSTRKKQMSSSFLILLTHTTPVNRAGSLLACPFGWGMVIESSCSMMFGVEISHWR